MNIGFQTMLFLLQSSDFWRAVTLVRQFWIVARWFLERPSCERARLVARAHFSISLSLWGTSIQLEWMVLLLTWMCLSAFLLCSWFICFLVSHELFQIDFLTCCFRNYEKSLPLADFMLFCPHFGWMIGILQLYSYQRDPQMYLHLRKLDIFHVLADCIWCPLFL